MYRIDRSEAAKQSKARDLLRKLASDGETILLWQVLGEFAAQLSSWRDRKLITQRQGERYLAAARRIFPIVLPVEDVLDLAIELASRYSLSHWDSMILGAAKCAGVNKLHTEDMGAPRVIDGIELSNPFV